MPGYTGYTESASGPHTGISPTTPENQVNSLTSDPKQGGKCWRRDKAGHFAKDCRHSRDHKCGKCGHMGHFEVCCHSKQNKGGDSSRGSSRGRGSSRTKPGCGRRGGNSKEQRDVHNVTGDTSTVNRVSSDDFYVFNAGSTDGQNTMELMIEDKLVNVVIDSGASCNLMSEEMFNVVTGGNARLLECNKRVYAYASVEPLQLKGMYSFNVKVPQTHKSLYTEFYVMRGNAGTLLGREASELLVVLRVGVSINSCDVKSDEMENLANLIDRKALLKTKFPKVFQGLGKLKGYQLKLHIDENVQPVAQPVRRVPFSRRAKVTEKLEELLKLDVIEKVEVQFCAKFIPNFATISSPLWDLTSKDVKWQWGAKESKTFQEIKDLLTRAPVMAYHRQGATTRLKTDASPVGVGAILEQKQEDGTYRPIYYASRKLSKVEARYSQFEREALAVRWACEKFYLYLYGIKFEVCTDHKQLVTVFSAKSKPPSARIERWLLYLQQFQYTLTHIPGKDNAADVLSRLPVGSTQDEDTQETEDFAYGVANAAVPAALLPKQVETASANDPTLQIVRKAVTTGGWTQLSDTIYKAVKDELWVVGQVVMRGTRIVMPQSLWKQTIMLAHEGRLGMVRTKARLRQKVWWPQMDKQVEDAIRSCHPCQLVGPRAKPEPLRSSSLPDRPWQEISVDLLEISNGEHLLVVVDYYSRWLEAILLKKTDAQHVIKSMEAIFRTHGLPDTLRSDNGPPFASKEFEGFLEYLGISHKKGVPYWPQSNGEVERGNEPILKIVRIARLEGKDWRKALQNFLFQYRVTPHTVTGVSHAELLMGRKLRDKLPQVEFSKDRPTEAYWQQLLRERDTRAKTPPKGICGQNARS